MRVALILLAIATLSPARAERVVWAWERPEALATLPPGVGVAAVVGFLRLRGGAVSMARGRRFPLTLGAGAPAPIGVVHIEVDQAETLQWTPALRDQVIAAAVGFAAGYASVQVDMEVRQSQRPALLDVLSGLRAALPPGTHLSMTALASWCETERWLAGAPVDEIVPMLFRMGRSGSRLRDKLAAGRDFAEPRCRTAVGVSLDAPAMVPSNRRVYIFNPKPWDATALSILEREAS